MPKINLNEVNTDNTADDTFEEIQERIAKLMAKNRVLQNELDTRATGDGDIFAMLELLEERHAELESRLKGELTLATDKTVGKPKSDTTELSEFDALALRIGQELLKRHHGDEAATRQSLTTVDRITAAGNQFGQFVMQRLDRLGTDPLVWHDGTLMIQSDLTRERAKKEINDAFDALVTAIFSRTRPAGNTPHVAVEAAKEVDRLRTEATALGSGDAALTDLLNKLGKLVGVTRDKKDNAQFESAIVDAIQKKIAASSEDAFLKELARVTGVAPMTGETFVSYVARVVTDLNQKAGVATAELLDDLGAAFKEKRGGRDNAKYQAALLTLAAQLKEDSTSYVWVWDRIKEIADKNSIDYQQDEAPMKVIVRVIQYKRIVGTKLAMPDTI